MAGTGLYTDLKPPYIDAVPNVKIWDSQKWVAHTSRLEKSEKRNAKCGPEISFGHAIAKQFPETEIRLIKYAVDASALYDDWAPIEGKQYVGFVKTVESALVDLESEGADYTIAGMLWLQGESDALENQGKAYEANLTAFISHMRTAFKMPEMPFIIARVKDHFGRKTGQAVKVRDAQAKVAETMKKVAWFDTDDCELFNEGHYNTFGLIKIGKRFAIAYKKVADTSKHNAKR
jgi:hypothetical protein